MNTRSRRKDQVKRNWWNMTVAVPGLLALGVDFYGNDFLAIKGGWWLTGKGEDAYVLVSEAWAKAAVIALILCATYWVQARFDIAEEKRRQIEKSFDKLKRHLDILKKKPEVRPKGNKSVIRANIMQPTWGIMPWADVDLKWSDWRRYHLTFRPLQMIAHCDEYAGMGIRSHWWAGGNGCAGCLWASNKAESNVVDLRNGKRGYRMTGVQRGLTKDVQAVLSFKITDRVGRLAVVNLETTDPELFDVWAAADESVAPELEAMLRKWSQQLVDEDLLP